VHMFGGWSFQTTNLSPLDESILARKYSYRLPSLGVCGLAEHSNQYLKDLKLIWYAYWCIRLDEEEMRFNTVK
jgi:hypothetical protein